MRVSIGVPTLCPHSLHIANFNLTVRYRTGGVFVHFKWVFMLDFGGHMSCLELLLRVKEGS